MLKLHVGMLGALGVVWATLTLAEPTAALDPALGSTRDLAEMESAFARDRDDAGLAERLADAYLAIHRADLVVAALSSASPEVQADPAVGHRLARAFEESGRVGDALATAELALARCGRSLGTAASSAITPIPERGCTERAYVSLEMHRSALARMDAWGVTDPRTDPRTRRAYGLSVRAARILSASASR
jgi:hypothetical protein